MSDFKPLIASFANEVLEEYPPGSKCFVLGFLFDKDDQVALITKVSPAWQAGKLNGLGGKVNLGEAPAAAMNREGIEEAGVIATWQPFGILKHGQNQILLFTARHPGYLLCSSPEGEVGWYSSRNLPSHAIHNLHWLVPLALDPREQMVCIEDNSVVA